MEECTKPSWGFNKKYFERLLFVEKPCNLRYNGTLQNKKRLVLKVPLRDVHKKVFIQRCSLLSISYST